ncbi:MAG TPA: cytochrome c biogenesis protein CcsA [Tepidisphaeraceae bacterium]|nr:cytochrome c biogenesis protein CcsA [Tepidisphaeraceae bacterium]
MTDDIKRILKPVASLRLTVGLLFISMVLVLAGTTAQRDMGIQDVLHNFFRTWWAKIYFHYFQPTPASGHSYIPGWFPLPGGKTLILLLLANLLAAHTVRFKFNRKRVGIILIHFGLILLLVGEMVTGAYAVESRMRIDVGGSSNWTGDTREAELAFVDTSPKDGNDHVVISQDMLERAAASGQAIRDSRLPVEVKVVRWYENAALRFPMERTSSSDAIDRLADTGADSVFGITRMPKWNGTESATDMPAAFIMLSKEGKTLGTYLVTSRFDPVNGNDPVPMLNGRKPQQLSVGGKTYELSLRFKRDYKPYTISLAKFTHDRFLGTDIAKDFASDVRLVDPARHVDRTARIWMNHPLRYLGSGETFYQASFDEKHDAFTILQVVSNPGWLVPYFACGIGALGLVIHFGTSLYTFAKRKAVTGDRLPLYLLACVFVVPGLVGLGILIYASIRRSRDERLAISGSTKKLRNGSGRKGSSSYSLPVERKWLGHVIPAAIVLVCVAYLMFRAVAQTTPVTPASTSVAANYDWEGFGRLPVQFEGRTQPLNSLARNSIKILSGRETPHDEKSEARPAEQWMLDVMTRGQKFADYKVIRIDHPQIKDLLGLSDKEKMFSWAEIFKDPANFQKIDEQAKLAGDKLEKDRDSYDNQISDFKQHLDIYLRLFQVDAIEARHEFMSNPEMVQRVYKNIADALSASDPGFTQKLQTASPADMERIFREGMQHIDPAKISAEQNEAISIWIDEMQRTRLLDQLTPSVDLYLAAPDRPADPWQPLASAVRTKNAPESAGAFLKIVKDYEDGKPDDFNADVAAYTSRLDRRLPQTMSKVDTELSFNRFDPFTVCMVFYVGVFVLTLASLLFRLQVLGRSAFWLLLLTLGVHTVGLALRIYISGRPPVTNLYSSAVFIAWGIVVFSAALQAIYRNGLGLLAGSVAGFTSLLVAAGLASTEGDTMKQLQAVLDTNFWLATHVVCVTLGYTATFLAGLLAIVYVLIAPFAARAGATGRRITGLFDGQVADQEIGPAFSLDDLKDVIRMVYGIVCFAMLFSFVGTILGGIWADQSWGRFWGWDPKENGAVLIVLWNALILHARWGGIVRDRGVAVLAIIGNIVTSWSWFGTNMLGIGLHSYGFMQSAQFYLILFMLTQVALAVIGMIPPRIWAGRPTTVDEPRRVLPVT